MSSHAATSKFESAVLEQLDAAHNLARWLMRNDQDAQDVVQESCMKALRAFDSFRGDDFRAWFLTIVRNTSFTWMRRNTDSQDLEAGAEIAADCETYDPQTIAMRAADADWVRRAIDLLPAVLREAVVLREMEGFCYEEIGEVLNLPAGTVKSRLKRGRAALKEILIADGLGSLLAGGVQ